MADSSDQGAAPTKRSSKRPLLIGIVLALVLGGGGYFAVHSGLLLAPSAVHADSAEVPPMPDIAYVPLDPLIINLGQPAGSRFLRFQAQVEVNGAHGEEVQRLTPRIIDVLNSYLRAVDVADLQDRSALVRLRAQMLRRVQLVTGEGRVRDLLIQEFVVN